MTDKWWDESWNPITGCSPASPGCSNCWARDMVKRFPHLHGTPNEYFPDALINVQPFSKIIFHPDRLDIPLRWKKPRRIFVGSMTDLFHEDVTDEMIQAVFGIMSSAGQHTYMVLTKRPERMRAWMEKTSLDECQAEMVVQVIEMRSPTGRRDRLNSLTINGPWPLPTIWLGVTAENQEMADQRIPILLQTPAAKRFVSVEPMLGPVDLAGIFGHDQYAMHHGIDWCIVGPENAPRPRPMDIEWARSLRDQARAAGVPFFMKSPRKGTLPADLMVQEIPEVKG